MERICNAEALAGVDKRDPSRATKIAERIARNVKTPSVRKATGELASAHAASRGALLRTIAKQHGHTGPCPMADTSEARSVRRADSPAAS